MSTSVRNLINNFSTTLNGSLTNSATTVVVTSASGISGGLTGLVFIPLTIDDGTNREIVYCTAVSSNTLTITRGQEGTSGTAFSSGATIECRATASSIQTQSEWKLIERRTLGGNAVTEDFTVSAGDYKVVLDGVFIDTNDDICYQQGTSGGIQTSNYYASGVYSTYLSTNSTNPTNNGSKVIMLPAAITSSANPIYGEVEVPFVGNASVKKCGRYKMSQQSKISEGTLLHDTAEAVTTIRITTTSGTTNFQSGSVFLLYNRN